MNFYAAIVFSCIIFNSCDKNDSVDLMNRETVALKVQVDGDTFSGTKQIEFKGSVKGTGMSSANGSVQRKEVDLEGGFSLQAELTIDTTGTIQRSGLKVLKNSTNAVSEATQVGSNVVYKLVVFAADGTYITERDYIRGQEATAATLNLDGGTSYTFVAYSLNNTAAPPLITFADPANKRLSTASVKGISGNVDLLYFRKTMELNGGSTNFLSIIFEHSYSQVTTTVDATKTGYTISALTANFDSHHATADLNLSNGSLVRPVASENIAVAFSGLNTAVVQSAPILLNGETNMGRFVISTLTIGPLTQVIPPDAISGLQIIPGMKYNLKLEINPKDTYLDHSGQKAVRINGKIWMRYNLGFNTTRDADQTPYISDQHGYYYQWGRSPAVAGRGATTTNGNWNSTPAAGNNRWNLGTSGAPVKNTANDPCPAGFRVPTVAEFQDLLNWTVPSNTGSFTDSNTNFSGVKVFTSKRNRYVKILFPMQGYFSYTTSGTTYVPTGITDRGSYGSAWASDRTNNTFRYLRMTSTEVRIGSNGPNAALALQATCIRCIAE